MAIEYKGGTRATCVNSDIISDSLGKSADGSNNGITLLGATETLKGTPDVNENYSSGWTTEAGSTVTINSNHVKSNNSPTNADHRVSKAL